MITTNKRKVPTLCFTNIRHVTISDAW